jgi:hypothetical protein
MRKKYWTKLKTLESSLPQSNSQARVRIKEHINIHVFYIFFKISEEHIKVIKNEIKWL